MNDNNDSKRQRINLESLPSFGGVEKIDRKKKEEINNKEKEEERKRVENISCPCCGIKDKEHVVKHKDGGNPVFGSKEPHPISDEYYVCNNCGNMFKDIWKNG